MSVEEGQQVLPTDGFDDSSDFEEATTAELDQASEDRQEDEQLVPDDDYLDPGDDEINEENDSTDEEENEETAVASDEAQEGEETEDDTDNTDDKQEPEQELTKKEEFERYSRSVQRRINKEVKQREDLRRENEELKKRFDELENRLSRQDSDSEAVVLDNRIRNATSMKQQLMEDGEYEKVAQVDNDIMQMKIHQAKLEERAQNEQYQDQNPQQYEENQYAEQQAQQEEYVPDIQKQWINNNDRFGRDEAYTQYVNTTYDAMIEEGYDPESQSMYVELNRRTGTKPLRSTNNMQRNTQAQRPAPRTRPKAAPAPNTGQAQASAKPTGLTEADKHNMRNWGMDPNDPSTRKEWLANKRK